MERNPYRKSEFDIIVDLIHRYGITDLESIFAPHSLQGLRFKNMVDSQKQMYDRLAEKYEPKEEYNPKEEPFEVSIKSNIKVN